MSLCVFDLHCDTLTAFRRPDRCTHTLHDACAAFSLQSVPKGTNWAQCCAVFAPDTLSPQQAEVFFDQTAEKFYCQMGEYAHLAVACTDGEQVEAAWEQGKTACLLTVENASVLGGKLERVETLRQMGVIMMTLTWNGENQLGSGNTTEHGLTPFGIQAIKEMERVDMVVDVSHLNDKGFWQVAEHATKPIVASHSNVRNCCYHPRNLTQEQIQFIIQSGGLVGLNYYSPFLREDGQPATREDVRRHLEAIIDLGGEHHVALGSDFDGADLPPELDCCKKIPQLYTYLESCGYSKPLLDRLFWKNAIQFFQRG